MELADYASSFLFLPLLALCRNLNVAEDNDLGKEAEEIGNIVSGLNCKIVVQFEKYKDFYNALRVLCGRSLQKVGSLFLCTCSLVLQELSTMLFVLIIMSH